MNKAVGSDLTLAQATAILRLGGKVRCFVHTYDGEKRFRYVVVDKYGFRTESQFGKSKSENFPTLEELVNAIRARGNDCRSFRQVEVE